MTATTRFGLMLGAGVVAWTFIMGMTGWYIHPKLLNLFWVVVIIQIGVLFAGLHATAVQGSIYWKQVMNGTLMSLIGGVLIFFGSMIFTMVVFPNYFADLRIAYTDMMRVQGMSDAQITQMLEAQAPTQTPFFQALFGFLGTLITGFIVSLILSAFIKPKASA